MTGEGLGLKPSTVEKSKFEYFPLGKISNKGLSKEDKKEGLLKKLKNIEEKNEQLLKIKNKTENIKDVTDFVKEPFSLEAKALIEQIRTIQKDVDYCKLKLEVVTKLRIILVIMNHLKSYLEKFITKK